jgi:hypothetical protein
MRILIIENDFDKKLKLWRLLSLNHGSIDMDFVYGTEEQDDVDEEGTGRAKFDGISLTLTDPMDAHKLESILAYQLEYEDGGKS